MPSPLARFVYRAAQRLMTLDITRIVWLTRERLQLPDGDEQAVTLRLLDADEVRRFSHDRTTDLAGDMADRLDTGRHFCLAALQAGHLASYAWFALEAIEAEHNRGRQPNSGVGIVLPPHVAFMYKGFTHPEFRGRGLYKQVVGRGLVALESYGIRALLSSMDWTNEPARRSLASIGFEELGLCCRWGWKTWMHTHAPPAACQHAVHFQ